MKKILSSFAVVCFAALTFTSCTKDAKDATANEVSVDAMSKIQKLGFSTDGVQKVNGGYMRIIIQVVSSFIFRHI